LGNGTKRRCSARGSTPVLWARDRAIVAAINERHENPLLLPGAILDPEIIATSDIDAATAELKRRSWPYRRNPCAR